MPKFDDVRDKFVPIQLQSSPTPAIAALPPSQDTTPDQLSSFYRPSPIPYVRHSPIPAQGSAAANAAANTAAKTIVDRTITQMVTSYMPGENITFTPSTSGNATAINAIVPSGNFLSLPNDGLYYLARANFGATGLETTGDASTSVTSGGAVGISSGILPTAADGVTIPVSVTGYVGWHPIGGLIFRSGRNCRYQARFNTLFDPHMDDPVIYMGFTDQDVNNMRTFPPSAGINFCMVAIAMPSGATHAEFLGAINNIGLSSFRSVVLNAGAQTPASTSGSSTTVELVMDDAANTTSFYVNGILGGVISGNNPIGVNAVNWEPAFYYATTSFAHLFNMQYFYGRQNF